ncbi:MAG: DUF4097 family beta strand repeat-containing protein [Bryobacteraceae bacterium]
MRRGSLIGPLLLVLIGVVFLVRNLHPEWLSWDLIARYWPFVLIGWGLLRAFEILIWGFSGKPLPQRGISGGEWVLVVLISVAGLTFSFVHNRLPHLAPVINIGGSAELFGEAFDYPVPEQSRAAAASIVVLDHLRGNVRIAGAQTREVRVGGRKTVRAYRQGDADQADAKTPVEILQEGDQLIIRSNQERASSDVRVSADLEITVPRESSIRAAGRSGDYDVLNVRGVELKADSGTVRVQDIAGPVRVDVRRSRMVRAVQVRGDVEILGSGRDIELEDIEGRVTVNGYYSGLLRARKLSKPLVFQSGVTELRLESLPGQVQMDLGELTLEHAVGPVHLVAKTKDVTVKDFQGELRVMIDRGDVNLWPRRAPTAPVGITTRNGDVTLSLPAGAAFTLEASTRRGEVRNDFGPPLEAREQGAGAMLRGSAGKGPEIKLHTERGRITVRKD